MMAPERPPLRSRPLLVPCYPGAATPRDSRCATTYLHPPFFGSEVGQAFARALGRWGEHGRPAMRVDFEGLLTDAPPLLTETTSLVNRSNPNLSCIISDFAAVNEIYGVANSDSFLRAHLKRLGLTIGEAFRESPGDSSSSRSTSATTSASATRIGARVRKAVP